MAFSLTDMYGQQGVQNPSTQSQALSASASPFNFNQSNYQGPQDIIWNFDTPWAKQQYELAAANSPNGAVEGYQLGAYNLGDDYYKNLGFTGQAWQGGQDLVNMSDGPSRMTDEFSNWLNEKGYTYGTGRRGGDPFSAYFDKNGNIVQNSFRAGSPDNKFFENFVLSALGLYGLGTAGGAALNGLSGAGAGAAAGSDLAYLEAADAAGGLIPEFGSTAAYEAGLGGITPLAGTSGFMGPPESLAGDPNLMGPPEILANPSGTNSTAITPGTTGVPTTGSIPSSSSLGQIGSGLSTLLGGGSGGLPQGLASLLGVFNANNQMNEWNQQMENLDKMYSLDSPYAKQMEQTLARKDSAAGRNSQYGPRSVELAAALTRDKANSMRDLISMRSNANSAQNSAIKDLGSILGGSGASAGIGQILSGLGTGWDELLKLFGD